jgi:hypothetical protein
MAATRSIVKKLKDGVETTNLIATPTVAATPPVVGAIANALHSTTSVVSTTSWAAAQFLGGVFPIAGIAQGILTMGDALWEIIKNCYTNKKGKIGVNVLDLLSGLPVIFTGIEAWNLHRAGAAWPLSVSLAAQGFAIQAGYDFLKAAAAVLYALKKGKVENEDEYEKQYKEKYQARLNQQYREVILQFFKFAGFLLLSLGPHCFVAGFVFLAAAGIMSLYQKSERFQRGINHVSGCLSNWSVLRPSNKAHSINEDEAVDKDLLGPGTLAPVRTYRSSNQ